jgi:hypothetical protein
MSELESRWKGGRVSAVQILFVMFGVPCPGRGLRSMPVAASMLVMRGESDWAEHARQQRAAMADMEDQMARWRADVFAGIESLEAEEAAEREAAARSGERHDDAPADAPPALRRVRQRVERGELDWLKVIESGGEDPDVRAVHVWMSTRLEVVHRAFGAISEDMTADEARAAIESTLGPRAGAGQEPRGQRS